MQQTSIVYVTFKCVVLHEEDQDPGDVLCDANYAIAIEPTEGQITPQILATEMMETENRGECDPMDHFSLL